MGDLAEFKLTLRLFLRAYPWRRVEPVPFAALRRPLAEAKLALITSAGLVPAGATPFDETVRGGDWSFREIPGDVEVETLVETHRSEAFDHSGLERDRNLAFPLDRLRELVASGRLGSLNRRHFSVMGSLTAVGRFVRETAPRIAAALVDDGVEAVLLVPV